MKWRELLTEAIRNSGPQRVLLCTTALLVAAVLAATTYGAAAQALQAESATRDAGSLVVIATALGDNGIDAVRCLSVGSWDAIEAVGGTSAVSITAHTIAGAPVPVRPVVGNVFGVWDPRVIDASPIAGAHVATSRDLTVGLGLTVTWSDEYVIPLSAIAEIGPDSYHSAVFLRVPPTVPLDQCLIRATPGYVDVSIDHLRTALAPDAVVVQRYRAADADAIRPIEVWRHFWAMQPVLVAGLVLAAVGWMGVWSRRTDIAVYRTFGLRRRWLVLLSAMETWLALTASSAVGAACGVVVGVMVSQVMVTTAALAIAAAAPLAAAAMAMALVPLAVTAVTRANVLVSLKDR